MSLRTFAVIAALMGTSAAAHEDIPDLYPQSPLYAKPVEVIPNVFSAIGATAPPHMKIRGIITT